jgi:hypothetical protein
VYIDDILSVSNQPPEVFNQLDQHYISKKVWSVLQSSISVHKWVSISYQTIQKEISVFPSGYRAELDVSELCSDDESEYYQKQVGVLHWEVELGRIDITVEVSTLASYTAAPRRGICMFCFICLLIWTSTKGQS